MFDDIDYKAFKRNFHYVKRFSDILFGTVAISQLLFFIPHFLTKDYTGNFRISNFNLYVCIIATFFLYFSLVRISTAFDEYYRAEYFKSDKPKDEFKTAINFWFINSRFWTEAVVFALIYALLPMELLHYGIVYYINTKGGIFQNKLFVSFLIILVMFAINLFARLTATKYWIQDKNFSESDVYEIRKNYKRSTYSKEYATALVVYLVGGLGFGLALVTVLALISPILTFAVYNFKTFAVILFLIFGVPFVFRTLRCLIMRFVFIHKLQKLCKRNKYRLSTFKNPYISIFKECKGESFNVQIGKRGYSCKLVACAQRHARLYLRPNGTGVFIKTIYFMKTELFHRRRNINFDYDSKQKQILILNPISKNLFSNHNGLIGEMDIGDIIGKFEIYSATSFLNALERDVIDK